jgi:archaellum component FlaC
MLLLGKVWRMANDSDPETPVSVSTGEVRVGKGFEADRFPVPAIAFEIESLADEPIRIRLVDRIPESFAMEGVGFHPDYDSDNWTAYRDHQVAYERTLEPDESVLTVYGIRIDDPEEAEAFLDEPTVELVESADADSAGDVLGRETTQVVRDALSGEESADLSALDEAGTAETEAETESESVAVPDDDGPESLLDEPSTATPRETDDEPIPAMRTRDETVTTVGATRRTADGESEDESAEDGERDGDGGEETDAAASADAAAAPDPRPAVVEADESPAPTTDDGADAADAAAPDTGAPAGTPGSVASALAAELREGSVDDDDLVVLREAFESEVPTSVDVRVGRLQSQVEDVLAYRDALADFLDENGTAEQVLGDVSEEVSDLHDRVDDLDASLSVADDDRAALREEVAETGERVADVTDRLDDVEDDLDRVESRLADLDEQLSAVGSVEADVEEIRAELDELRSFRDRLNSAFGPGEE